MSPGRPAFTSKQRDANEPTIVETLRGAGARVYRLDLAGGPDLLVGFQGGTFLLEVKIAEGRLNPAQVEWHNLWRGRPVMVVRDPVEALRAIGAA